MKIWEILKAENIGNEYKFDMKSDNIFKVHCSLNGVITLRDQNGNLIEQVYNLVDLFRVDFEQIGVCWKDVPVDTPILVKDFREDEWLKRYFAKYENGDICAWKYGRDSFTATDEEDYNVWTYAKIYNK